MFSFILNSASFFSNLRGVILKVPEECMYVKVHKFNVRWTSHNCYMHSHCGFCTHEVAISLDVLRYVLTVFAIDTCVTINAKQVHVQLAVFSFISSFLFAKRLLTGSLANIAGVLQNMFSGNFCKFPRQTPAVESILY